MGWIVRINFRDFHHGILDQTDKQSRCCGVVFDLEAIYVAHAAAIHITHAVVGEGFDEEFFGTIRIRYTSFGVVAHRAAFHQNHGSAVVVAIQLSPCEVDAR